MVFERLYRPTLPPFNTITRTNISITPLAVRPMRIPVDTRLTLSHHRLASRLWFRLYPWLLGFATERNRRGALWKFRFQPLVPNTSEERMGKARFKGPNRERGNWTRVQIEIRIEILEYEGVQCLIEVV